MEPLFVERHEVDYEFAKKMTRFLIFQYGRTQIVMQVLVLSTGWLAMLSWVKDDIAHIVSVCFLFVLLFVRLITSYYNVYKISVRRNVDQPMELSQGHLGRYETVVTGQELISTNEISGSFYRIHISRIKQISVTSDRIYLHTRADMVYALDKNCFLKGSPEQLLAFFASGNYPIKYYKK